MTPIPPSSVLFMLQSGYSAERIMPIMLDSINGINNESNRLRRPTDQKFTRLVELIREGQIAGAILGTFDANLDGTGNLTFAYQLGEAGEFLICRPSEPV